MKTKLSVIIPMHNEEKDILDCLKSLDEQAYKDFEIIVVDDGSKDNTLKVVEDYKKNNKKIKILRQAHKGPGTARNLAAKEAKGNILIFIDSDMTFDKEYLQKLTEPFKDNENVIGTTHELEIVNNIDNIWSRCWGKIRVSKKEASKVKIFRAIRKAKFLELGGFNSKYGYADDQTFWFKYKIKPKVADGSICYHKNPETLKGVYRQSKWIGASHSVNILKFIGAIFLFPILIPMLSIIKSHKNKDFIIFAYMLVFITARYFGNLKGYWNKIVWKKNFR